LEIRNKYFGYIFQDPYLHPNFNVENNIKTPLFISKKSINKNSFKKILSRLGLEIHIKKYINDVSGGERQRVSIFRGLIMDNPIIVGDELTSNIDYKKGYEILWLIKNRVNNTLYFDKNEYIYFFKNLNRVDFKILKPYIEILKNNYKYMFIIKKGRIPYKILVNIENSLEKFLPEERKKFGSQYGTTFIWVTHDIHMAKKFADKIITIKDSKLDISENPNNFDKLINLLDNNNDDNVELALNKEPYYNVENVLSFFKRFKYFFSYALLDIFKTTKSFFKFRPSADFLISFISILLVMLFLLSIIKLDHATNKFLSVKLSDPRINYLRIKASRVLAGGLTDKHIKDLRKHFLYHKIEIKHIAPIYAENIGIKKYKQKKKTLMNDVVFTFNSYDPIINDLIKNKLPFINDNDNYKGIIIYKPNFINVLKYPEYSKEILIDINNRTEIVPVLAIDKPLPLDSYYLIRKKYYFEAYMGNDMNIEKPNMDSIIIYPKDIHDMPSIVNILNTLKNGGIANYEIVSASDLVNMLGVINELESLIGLISFGSIVAVALLSIAFIMITVYRNINNKKKEIGIFLAYGMKSTFFYKFYLIESCILSFISSISSYILFNCIINPFINQKISGKFSNVIENIDPRLKAFSSNVDPNDLNIPKYYEIYLYIGISILICFVFYFLIKNIIKKLPVELMKRSL